MHENKINFQKLKLELSLREETMQSVMTLVVSPQFVPDVGKRELCITIFLKQQLTRMLGK